MPESLTSLVKGCQIVSRELLPGSWESFPGFPGIGSRNLFPVPANKAFLGGTMHAGEFTEAGPGMTNSFPGIVSRFPGVVSGVPGIIYGFAETRHS